MVELIGDEGPTLVFATDTILNWNTHVIEEHSVDVVFSDEVELLQGDARCVHRHDENADALVLGSIGVGAHCKPAVVCIA